MGGGIRDRWLLISFVCCSYFPLDHQLIGTDEKGDEQPLIAWDSMTAAARNALENTDFGDATPSFLDVNFESKYLPDAAL